MEKLVGDEKFDGWWGAVMVLAGVDARFVVTADRVDLAPGVTDADFTAPHAPADVAESAEPETVDVPFAMPANGMSRAAIWASALGMANTLASLHARGETMLRRPESTLKHGEGWTIRADTEADARLLYGRGADYLILPNITAGQYFGKTVVLDPTLRVLEHLRQRDIAMLAKRHHFAITN